MACDERKLFLRSLVVLIAPFFLTVIFLSQAAAAQLEDACRARCQEMAEQFRKEKGAPLPASIFNECVDSCMHPPQIRSEADIPPFCNSRCERLLKNMGSGVNPATVKACKDRCIGIVTQKFRQSLGQGQKKQ